MLQLGKAEPELPDVGGAEYLTEWLAELGWYRVNGAGVQPIPHSEIGWWARNAGLHLRGQEAAWLFAMSQAYATEIGRSDDKDVGAPFSS